MFTSWKHFPIFFGGPHIVSSQWQLSSPATVAEFWMTTQNFLGFFGHFGIIPEFIFGYPKVSHIIDSIWTIWSTRMNYHFGMPCINAVYLISAYQCYQLVLFLFASMDWLGFWWSHHAWFESSFGNGWDSTWIVPVAKWPTEQSRGWRWSHYPPKSWVCFPHGNSTIWGIYGPWWAFCEPISAFFFRLWL